MAISKDTLCLYLGPNKIRRHSHDTPILYRNVRYISIKCPLKEVIHKTVMIRFGLYLMAVKLPFKFSNLMKFTCQNDIHNPQTLRFIFLSHWDNFEEFNFAENNCLI